MMHHINNSFILHATKSLPDLDINLDLSDKAENFGDGVARQGGAGGRGDLWLL